MKTLPRDPRAQRQRRLHQRASRATIASPRPRPFCAARRSRVAVRDLIELLEHAVALGLADADAGVPDLHQQTSAARRGSSPAPSRPRCSGSRSTPGCGRCARRGADPRWTDMAAAAQPQRQPLLERGRLEVQADLAQNLAHLEMSAGRTSTPPLSIRVMSSSSENRPSSASTDSLTLLTSCATSGSWVRCRSASANRPIACSGWRRSWLAAAKNCVFARLAISASCRAASASGLLGAQLLGQHLGAQLQGDDAVERGAVVAAEDDDHRHRHRHQRGGCQPSSTCLTATAAIAGPNTSVTKTTKRRELRRQDRHAGDAEGVDDEHQGDLLRPAAVADRTATRPRPRARRRPARRPASCAAAPAGASRCVGSRRAIAQGQAEPDQPDHREQRGPAEQQRPRHAAGEDEDDQHRADQVAGERRCD